MRLLPIKKQKILLLSSRPIEHSGMTKIELDVIDNNKDTFCFDVASGWKCDEEFQSLFDEKNVQYIELPKKSKILSYMYGIYRCARRNGYDKIYIHGNSSLMILEAFPAKMAGAKVITHCHNTRPNRFSLHYALLKPLFSCFVDYKVACSKKASDWAYCGKKIIIKNGIDIEKFRYDYAIRSQMRNELGVKDKLVIGHIIEG